MSEPVALSVETVTKSFGLVPVLRDINLNVPKGKYVSLLGPSGCGKTTLLNIIGGLERPSSGEIELFDRPIFSSSRRINVPPDKRNTGFVFQSYALWPHKTVAENVAFPLRVRGLAREEREKRTLEILEHVELGKLADRYPYQLSGGQQQRAAIARALVHRPDLVLLDEPLSNLDAQLRERARAWLRRIHDELGLTSILVTHDQAEALSLSDTVVVIREGRVEQIGSPVEIYETPRTRYIAEFVGGANVLEAKLREAGRSGSNGQPMGLVDLPGGLGLEVPVPPGLAAGDAIGIAIRPSKIVLVPDTTASGLPEIGFRPDLVLYQGGRYEIVGTTPLGQVRVVSEGPPPEGSIKAVLDPAACRGVIL